MKIKYLRMSKEEQKKARQKYFATETGKYVNKKLKAALTCAILLLLISIYNIYDAFFITKSLFDQVYAIFILLIGFTLIIVYHKIMIKKINQYVTRNKK